MQKLLASPKRPNQVWDPAQPLFEWVTGEIAPFVKRPELDADYSCPANVEV
jgi:hypothetical protein